MGKISSRGEEMVFFTATPQGGQQRKYTVALCEQCNRRRFCWKKQCGETICGKCLAAAAYRKVWD